MEDAIAHLLELAANNDVFRFRKFADQNPSSTVDQIGMWYVCRKGIKQMVVENRTPLMVAATYGSFDVVKLILSLFEVDVNKSCGQDKTTALHCAASGGSKSAVEIVQMLLAAGANPNLTDASGYRPFDVIAVSPKFEELKLSLQRLLRVSTWHPVSSVVERREYPTNMYSTDEFRMFQFKVHSCSRAYAHDWTECPFFHPGENARRRDPMKYRYKSVPCVEYRRGYCRKGDMCEYAHGTFECWMHPAQYRTRMCKEGGGCNRKVCFFAHSREELRPLRFSTGPILRSPSFIPMIDYAAAMNLLPYCPPVSPSNYNIGWNQPQQFVNPNANGYYNAAFQQQQNILSPNNYDQYPLMQTSFGVSPRSKEQISPMSSRTTSNLAPRESLPKWGTCSSQKTEFGETSDHFGKQEYYEEEEPDVSWVHNLVKDTTYDDDDDIMVAAVSESFGEGTSVSGSDDPLDPAVLKALLDQMEMLDQINSQQGRNKYAGLGINT